MRLAIVPFLFALAADSSTCGPEPLPPTGGGGNPGYQIECTPPARSFVCTVHFYNGCGVVCGNQPVTVADATCATDSASASAIVSSRWLTGPGGSMVGGGISGVSVLGCQPGNGVQTNPPTSSEQQTMCSAWCASPGCVDNNGTCTSNGDCCSNSCDMVANVCT